jgi:anti-sigma factor RsiW
MNCRSAEPLLSAFLEDDLSQNERRDLEAHLLSCRRCSVSVRELRSTLELLYQAPTVETSPNFEADLMARIRSGEGLRPSVIEWLRGYLDPARLRPVFLAGAGACAVWIAVILAGPNGILGGSDAARIASDAAAPKATITTPDATEAADGAKSATAAPRDAVASESTRPDVALAASPNKPKSGPQPAPSKKADETSDASYVWADQDASGLPAGQDSTIPNPGFRYDDEYITDQFILERGFEDSKSQTITPVSDRPSDDVYITF